MLQNNITLSTKGQTETKKHTLLKARNWNWVFNTSSTKTIPFLEL